MLSQLRRFLNNNLMSNVPKANGTLSSQSRLYSETRDSARTEL